MGSKFPTPRPVGVEKPPPQTQFEKSLSELIVDAARSGILVQFADDEFTRALLINLRINAYKPDQIGRVERVSWIELEAYRGDLLRDRLAEGIWHIKRHAGIP